MIGAADITALARHRVQTAGGQGGEALQGLTDERQIGVDLGGSRRGPEAGQTRLRQHPADHVVVDVQLPRDGPHSPFFGVVIAQDLGLDVRRCDHVRNPFGRVAAGGGCGGSEIPDGRDRRSGARTNGSAGSLAQADPRGKLGRSRPPASWAAANHRSAVGGNRDASLSFAAPGSGPSARHGRAAPDGCPGIAARPHAGCDAGRPGAVSGAVDLAAVAIATDQRLGPTPRAKKQPTLPRRATLRIVATLVFPGGAEETWTRARVGGIIAPHSCPAQCGARRRA